MDFACCLQKKVRRGGTVQYSSFHVRVKVCSSSNLPLHYSIVSVGPLLFQKVSVGIYFIRKYLLASSLLESIGWPLLFQKVSVGIFSIRIICWHLLYWKVSAGIFSIRKYWLASSLLESICWHLPYWKVSAGLFSIRKYRLASSLSKHIGWPLLFESIGWPLLYQKVSVVYNVLYVLTFTHLHFLRVFVGLIY